MTAHAREAHPMEAVGAVLGAGGVAVDYVRLENVTNVDYRVHGSGTNMPGRNLIVTLETRF